MKILAEKRSSIKLGLMAFLVGGLSLFIPHFSGWSEIVLPQFAFIGLIVYFMWRVLFVVALGLSLLNMLTLFFTNVPSKAKVISTCLVVGLIALFLSVYPDFMTMQYPGLDQRISFFAVGGRTRMIWAGGIETVKSDALTLLKHQPDDKGFVSSDVWPSSLKRLGVVAVTIDNETQSIIIYLPEAQMSEPDQFGYLITNEQKERPKILKRENHNRLWKLKEGVYFFEMWE